MAWDRGAFLAALGQIAAMPRSLRQLLFEARATVVLWLPFLVALSLAQIALRLQPPRPPWHRLLQQPGAVACALASLIMVPIGLTVLEVHLFSGRPPVVAWARIATMEGWRSP